MIQKDPKKRPNVREVIEKMTSSSILDLEDFDLKMNWNYAQIDIQNYVFKNIEIGL